MPVKGAILDLSKTLQDPSGGIVAGVTTIIQQLRQMGIPFVLAEGVS